ncbi:hypothetical protein PMAYCL1PPCAC_15685, partial [Pristionchus mayeri]
GGGGGGVLAYPLLSPDHSSDRVEEQGEVHSHDHACRPVGQQPEGRREHARSIQPQLLAVETQSVALVVHLGAAHVPHCHVREYGSDGGTNEGSVPSSLHEGVSDTLRLRPSISEGQHRERTQHAAQKSARLDTSESDVDAELCACIGHLQHLEIGLLDAREVLEPVRAHGQL